MESIDDHPRIRIFDRLHNFYISHPSRVHTTDEIGANYKSIANSRARNIHVDPGIIIDLQAANLQGRAGRRGVNCNGLIADQARIETRAGIILSE